METRSSLSSTATPVVAATPATLTPVGTTVPPAPTIVELSKKPIITGGATVATVVPSAPSPDSKLNPTESDLEKGRLRGVGEKETPRETVNWGQRGLQIAHMVGTGLALQQAFNVYGPEANEDPSKLEQVVNNMMPLATFGLFHVFSRVFSNLLYKSVERVVEEGNGNWFKGFSSSVGKALAATLPTAGFAAALGVGLYFAPVSWGILSALNAYPMAVVAVSGVVSLALTMAFHYAMWKEDPFVSKGEPDVVHPLQRVGQNILETATAGMVALALNSWDLANQFFGYVMDWAFKASALATEFVLSVWTNRVVGHLSQTVRPFDRMVPERDLDQSDPLLAEYDTLDPSSFTANVPPKPTPAQQAAAHGKYAGFYVALLATVGVLGFVVDRFGGENVPSPAKMEEANLLRLMTYLTCVGATALAAFNAFRWTVMENTSKTWAGMFSNTSNKATSPIVASDSEIDLTRPLYSSKKPN